MATEDAHDAELLDSLVVGLAAEGSVRAEVADLVDGASNWRRTARAAGRQLGRPIQTLEMRGMVHAVLRDYPASPEEARQLDEKMRRAMQGASFADGASLPELVAQGHRQRPAATSPVQPATRANKVVGIEVVSLEQNVATEFESTPVAGTVVARRREASLVDDFAAHLGQLGHTLGRHRIRIAEGSGQLATDLFDETERILYEAKSSVDRSTIRLGLGQILDYRRFLASEDLTYQLLLPSRPLGELVDLLAYYEIGVTWRDGGRWREEPSAPHGAATIASGRPRDK